MRRPISRGVRSVRTICVLLAALVLSIGADNCPSQTQSLIAASIKVLLPQDIENTPGIRIHFYPAPGDTLPQGTEIRSFSSSGGNGRTLVCGSEKGCLMIFVDTDHWAHFAHRTVIALWEFDTKSFQRPIIADWWPMVNDEPVFNTVSSRETMFLERFAPRIVFADPASTWGEVGRTGPYDPQAVTTPSSAGTAGSPTWFTAGTGPGCGVWAVLVNGYKDEMDTFEEDTNGMYAVLTGLGVPADQIYFLSPNHGVTPCLEPLGPPVCAAAPTPRNCVSIATADLLCQPPSDTDFFQRSSYCNLKNVLETHLPSRINPFGRPCSELLIFLSTHGFSDEVICGENTLCHTDLKAWLSDIPCQQVTVVVEACQSGRLIPLLAPPPTAHPTQKRVIFTSTSANGLSYRDIDWLEHPYLDSWTPDTNPGDAGSETIWGFVEAFAAGLSDNNPGDDKISFAEAWQYAYGNDVMRVNNLNNPQVNPTPAPTHIANSCAGNTANSDLRIVLSTANLEQATGSIVGIPKFIRGRPNTVDVDVTNQSAAPATPPVPAANVRLYWSDEVDPKWPEDFFNHSPGPYVDHQIGNTILFTGLVANVKQSRSIPWTVSCDFDSGAELTLIAVVDSPEDPVPMTSTSVIPLVAATNNASTIKVKIANSVSNPICPIGCRTLCGN